MTMTARRIVVGGGFYGAYLALDSARRLGVPTVLLERDSTLLGRASYANQARVHHGYHYPRSVVTAVRSRINLPRFLDEFEDCIDGGFQKLYAIARGFSKVNARQFKRFCDRIEAPLAPAPEPIVALFDSARIEGVFLAEEPAFDAVALRTRLIELLARYDVDVRTGHEALAVRGTAGRLELDVLAADSTSTMESEEVFVCTYARTNQLLAASGLPRIRLKHEIAEIALVEPPPEIEGLGVTVMCGPFFSTMPFPARGLHSLSHVRYTPHTAWTEEEEGDWVDPFSQLGAYPCQTRVEHMIQDAQRYLPIVADCRPVESLWEVKTVLPKNDVDDGRPILYRAHHGLEGLHVIMGSKIDNVYDVLDAVEASASTGVSP